MSGSEASPRITPTIRRLVGEAAADGWSAGDLLDNVRDHARRHGNALTFQDAVEIVRLLEDRETYVHPPESS